MCLKYLVTSATITVPLSKEQEDEPYPDNLWGVGIKTFKLEQEEESELNELWSYFMNDYKYEFIKHEFGLVSIKNNQNQDVEYLFQTSSHHTITKYSKSNLGYHLQPFVKESLIEMKESTVKFKNNSYTSSLIITIPVIFDMDWFSACSANTIVVEKFLIPLPELLLAFYDYNKKELEFYREIHKLINNI